MPTAWSGAKTNINSISTPVSTVSNQSLRSSRRRRKSLLGSRIIVACSNDALLVVYSRRRARLFGTNAAAAKSSEQFPRQHGKGAGAVRPVALDGGFGERPYAGN